MDQPSLLLAERILLDALQKETVAAGLYRIYDAVIAWAEEVPLKAVVAFNAELLDANRSAEAIQQYPAEAYLAYWGEKKLRSELVFVLNNSVMDVTYRPEPLSTPPAAPGMLSDAEIREIAQALAARLTIEEGIDFFEEVLARFASLADHEKVLRDADESEQDLAAWEDEDFFREVLRTLYFGVIEPAAGHGVPVRVKGAGGR